MYTQQNILKTLKSFENIFGMHYMRAKVISPQNLTMLSERKVKDAMIE